MPRTIRGDWETRKNLAVRTELLGWCEGGADYFEKVLKVVGFEWGVVAN